MSLATARRDIENRLQDNWATTPLVFDNQPFAPRTGASWVRVQIFEEDVQRINIGMPGYHRVSGLVVMSIYTPIHTGSQTAREYADTLAALFRDQELSGITFREVVPATIGEVTVAGNESPWWQYDVSARFEWEGIYTV